MSNVIEKGVSFLYQVKDEASKRINDIGKAIKDLNSSAARQQGITNLNQNILAARQAINSAISTFKNFINIFAESEKASTKLSQALKNQGIESKAVQKDIEEYSKSLQQASLFSSDLITTVQAGLVSVGLQGDELKRATQATLDFASATGMDLVSAGKLMEKAAAGNISVLSKYGVQIKTTGDASTDFANALTKLEGRYQGMSKAIADTPTGKLVQFGNAWADFQKQIGEVLVKAISPIISGLTSMINWISNAPGPVKAFIAVFAALVVALFALFPVVLALIPAFSALVPVISLAIWPITAVVVAIAALAAGVVFLMDALAPSIDKLEKNSQALEKNRQALEKAKKEYGENSKEVSKYTKELKKLEDQQAKLKDKAVQEEVKRLQKEGFSKDEATKIAQTNVQKTIQSGQKTEAVKHVNTEQTNYSQGFTEFAKNENLKTGFAAQEAEKRKQINVNEAMSYAELEKLKMDMAEQKAKSDLEQTENKLAALDAYYLAQQEKYVGNEEALAELDLFYAEQKMQLEQQHIKNIEALRDQQYQNNNNVYQNDLKNYAKMLDAKNYMTKSQAQDFATWQSFMSSAASSENKNIAAIGKALAIYDITNQTARAASAAYSSMAPIPIVGPALGIAAAAAAVAFGAEQIAKVNTNSMALAEGGTFTATQPTFGQLGGQPIEFGEAGAEQVTFQPLAEDGDGKKCYIVIEGSGADTLVEALYYKTKDWERRSGR